ncbi:NADPH:quinone reductase [Aquamicrobium sp. LC103]|uniref:NADPH:quinone reductase n=1 Tax=Aquamicrobium sp. LC103 TaxID=1120658 RepID=UPI00063E7003|nr:NADPH:quinone reductase [Aquamicrobium sp. LC103]TKT74145.1 NADPH:quinone reductase [Aquamicrobium sp. LC103]
MKAAWYERNGKAREVLVAGETETPRPGVGEVLVRLSTSGVNPSDVKSRAGRPLAFPRIVPHSDGAGVIEAVGDGVDKARIGERVWTWNGQWKRPFGTAAEFIALPSAQAVRLPDNVDFDAGACLGIPALTALHAVELHGDIAGRTLLVTGAAAAVGDYAVQIAKLRGAQVIGTASATRADHAKAAGADHVIDYKTENVAERVREITGGRGVDAVIDMDLSSTAALLSEGVLAPHGKMVCYGSNVPGDIPISFPAMLWGSLTLQVFVVYELLPEERKRAVGELNRLLQAGALRHSIGATFPLAEIAAAHETVENGRITGNVVLKID